MAKKKKGGMTAAEMGRRGGLSRAKNLDKEALSAIGKKAAAARWGKKGGK